MYYRIFISMMFLVFAQVSFSCSKKSSDAEKIANALANRLTEALDFTGGSLVDAEKPKESDSAAAPQIEKVIAPAKIHPGVAFTVRLNTSYDKPEELDKAIVHVIGSSKHLVVNAPLAPLEGGWKMTLNGVLNEDLELLGGTFKLEYALQNRDGLTGLYKQRELLVPEEEEQPECDSGACCNGGFWVEAGDICLEEDDYECTEDLCTAEHACEVTLSDGYCMIADKCYEADTPEPDNDCRSCQPSESTSEWSSLENGIPCTSGLDVGTGECRDGVCEFAESFVSKQLHQYISPDEAEEVAGEPPAGTTDEVAAPQILSISAPDTLHLGADYKFLIFYKYTGESPIKSVLMYVEGAENHYEMPAHINEATTPPYVAVTGSLGRVEGIPDKSYRFEFALTTEGGTVGEHLQVTVPIVEESKECQSGETCCNGGSWMAKGSFCSDGNLCTFDDVCDEAHECGGTEITCENDAETCGIQRSCNGTDACTESYPGSETSCDDENDCTYSDVCDGSGSCGGTEITCENDAETCGIQRSCNGTDACTESYPGSETSCDDENDCTYSDVCDGSGSCGGTEITCENDAETCGIQRSCNGTDACTESYPGSETSCDDENDCTYSDVCDGSGVCGGTEITCENDAETCGIQRSCNGTDACTESYPGSETSCDDENDCTYSDVCDGSGVCGGTEITCENDAETCGIQRSCNGTDACTESYPGSETSCDDENDCTYSDVCDGSGVCGGTEIVCENDAETCGIQRACNGTDACTESYPGSETSCDDENDCTYSDVCDGSGVCGGTEIVCENDAETCGIQRACNGTDACTESYPGSETSCDDENDCTYSDVCDGSGVCGGTEIVCENDAETCGIQRACNGTDACTESYPGSETSCSDDLNCTLEDVCDGEGNCEGLPVECGDHASCTESEGSCQCESDYFPVPESTPPACASPCDPTPCTGAHMTCHSISLGTYECGCEEPYVYNEAEFLCAEPEPAQNNTREEASPVQSLPANIKASIDSSADEDWFRLDYNSRAKSLEQLLKITTISWGDGLTDTQIEIYASDAETLLLARNDDGGEDGFSVLFYPANVGTYYIRITGIPVDAGASYLLRIETVEGCYADENCQDGIACNGWELCVNHQCEAGTAFDCGAGSCVEPYGECVCNECAWLENGVCATGECCYDSDCDDGLECTEDSCDEGVCLNQPDNGACSDGLYCNGVEICDISTGCQPGQPPTHPYSTVSGCAKLECDEEQDKVILVGDDDSCQDGLYCNGVEYCKISKNYSMDGLVNGSGYCTGGVEPDVSDGVECTWDDCNEGEDLTDNLGEATHSPEDSYCDDGNPCTVDICGLDGCSFDCKENGDMCDNNIDGTCQDCACATGCQQDENCNDGDDCTTDTCNTETGKCAYELMDCDDGNPCTINYCENGYCYEDDVIEGVACDDETPCTVNDKCSGYGSCYGTYMDCSEDYSRYSCRSGYCEGGECLYESVNEGGYCTSEDTNYQVGICQEGNCVSVEEAEPYELQDCTSGIVFMDPMLEEIVREQANVYGRDLLSSDVQGITSIMTQGFPYGTIKHLGGIECLTNLETLDIPFLRMENLYSLILYSEFNSEELEFNDPGHYIKDLKPLQTLTKLKHLGLSMQMWVHDLTPLASMENLEYLNLDDTAVTDVFPLSGMTKLKTLSMSHYYRRLMFSEAIDIPQGYVADISPFVTLTQLENLQMPYNLIRDAAALSNLPNLQNINLISNNIEDLTPFVDNENIGSGVVLNLVSNFFNCTEQRTAIRELYARGVKLTTSCDVYEHEDVYDLACGEVVDFHDPMVSGQNIWTTYGCDLEEYMGPEMVYRYVAEDNGTASFTYGTEYPEEYRAILLKDCDPYRCVNLIENGTRMDLPVQYGDVYCLVVEGPGYGLVDGDEDGGGAVVVGASGPGADGDVESEGESEDEETELAEWEEESESVETGDVESEEREDEATEEEEEEAPYVAPYTVTLECESTGLIGDVCVNPILIEPVEGETLRIEGDTREFEDKYSNCSFLPGAPDVFYRFDLDKPQALSLNLPEHEGHFSIVLLKLGDDESTACADATSTSDPDDSSYGGCLPYPAPLRSGEVDFLHYYVSMMEIESSYKQFDLEAGSYVIVVDGLGGEMDFTDSAAIERWMETSEMGYFYFGAMAELFYLGWNMVGGVFADLTASQGSYALEITLENACAHRDCNDGNPCTEDTCEPETGACGYEALEDGTPYREDYICWTYYCLDGEMTRGSVEDGIDCEGDGNPCTVGVCLSGECEEVAVTESLDCDDGMVCSTDDVCVNGVCTGQVPSACDDGLFCTDDKCLDSNAFIRVETEFEDIRETGVEMSFGVDEYGGELKLGGPVELDFDFPFYDGEIKHEVWIGIDGVLFFSLDFELVDYYYSSSYNCLNQQNYRDLVAPFWTSYNRNNGGKLYYSMMGEGSERRLIVQWDDFLYYNYGDYYLISVQAALYADGRIEFHYKNFDSYHGSFNAVIGMVSTDDDDQFIQYACNESNTIEEGMALRYDASSPYHCRHDPATNGGCLIDGVCYAEEDPCDDGDPCTTADTCLQGSCLGEEYSCEDENDCTEDVCDGVGGCSNEELADETPCTDDANTCTIDQCIDGVCTHDPIADDTPCAYYYNPCMVGLCSQGYCDTDYAPDGTPCYDDGDPCTTDACSYGDCYHDPAPDGTACQSDLNPCTDDICLEGVCAHEEMDCDDDNPCTEDVCGGKGDCQHSDLPNGEYCTFLASVDGDEEEEAEAALVDGQCWWGVCQENYVAQDCVDDVRFADANLEAVVREVLEQPEGPLMAADLAEISVLTAENRNIRYLGGLECLTGLQELNLYLNQIEDLTPIAGLTNLGLLDVSMNSLISLAPIAGLVNLDHLYVSHNEIDSLEALDALVSLEWLSANSNLIENIGVLGGMTDLKGLTLWGNRVADVSPLTDVSGLEYLDISYNPVTDVSVLASMTQLHSLYLRGNAIADASDLAALDGLVRLDLGYNPISNLSFLQGFTQIDFLNLGYTQVEDLTPLSGLDTLTMLYLSHANVTDISSLSDLVGLTHLDLSYNGISDVGPLENLDALAFINLGGNKLGDITALGQLPALESLNLRNNAIYDIDPLADNFGLGSGDMLNLSVNPFDCKQQGYSLHRLSRRGVILDVSCWYEDCQVDFEIACGETLTADTVTDGRSTLDYYRCVDQPFGGNEVIYSFTAPALCANCPITISLEADSGDFGLFLLDSCNPLSCLASSSGQLNFLGESNRTYFVVVDTPRGLEGSFSLSVECDTRECRSDQDCIDAGIGDLCVEKIDLWSDIRMGFAEYMMMMAYSGLDVDWFTRDVPFCAWSCPVDVCDPGTNQRPCVDYNWTVDEEGESIPAYCLDEEGDPCNTSADVLACESQEGYQCVENFVSAEDVCVETCSTEHQMVGYEEYLDFEGDTWELPMICLPVRDPETNEVIGGSWVPPGMKPSFVDDNVDGDLDDEAFEESEAEEAEDWEDVEMEAVEDEEEVAVDGDAEDDSELATTCRNSSECPENFVCEAGVCIGWCSETGCDHLTGSICNPNNGRCEMCPETCGRNRCCNLGFLDEGAFWYCGTCCDPVCGENQVCSEGQCIDVQCPVCNPDEYCGAATGYRCITIRQGGDYESQENGSSCLPANSRCIEGVDECCSGSCLMGTCL